jgi:hypothetical protein
MPFDADTFLNSVAAGPMSTSLSPCPEGEYKAIIDDSDKAITFMEGTNKNGEPFHKMNVSFKILDDAVRATLKRENVFVPMQMFLDLTTGNTLDTSEGKNVSIGRLRAVLDQNSGDWKPSDLKGKGPLMVKVTQRSDNRDPTIKYAEVSRVAKIS